jgi:uncharacterized phage protein (TIGR02216 family)|tara:strand:+ start:444 stop:587 length:144 start_codon:yes stop_codon:yes gene_type:complete
MTPATFWDLSPREFVSAVNGFMLTKGGKRNSPVLKDEMKDLMRRFPD